MSSYVCVLCKRQHYNFSPWCTQCLLEISEKELNTKDLDIKNKKTTPSIKQDKQQIENETGLKTSKKNESAQDKITQTTKSIEISSELREQKRTEKESAKMLESPTKEISNQESKELANIKTELIPSDPSLEASPNLNKELSRSINFLTGLETELFQTMQSLRSQQPDVAVRLYDPERAQTAIECAKQIINSKRMKLDLFKFAKEVINENSK